MGELHKCCRCGHYRATGSAEIEGSIACAPCAREHHARPARPLDTGWVLTVSLAFLALLVLACAGCEPALEQYPPGRGPVIAPVPVPAPVPSTPAGMVVTTDGILTYAPGGAVR